MIRVHGNIFVDILGNILLWVFCCCFIVKLTTINENLPFYVVRGPNFLECHHSSALPSLKTANSRLYRLSWFLYIYKNRHESGINVLILVSARQQIIIFPKMSNYSFNGTWLQKVYLQHVAMTMITLIRIILYIYSHSIQREDRINSNGISILIYR